MKYIKVEWSEIQDYMNHPDWKEGHYYDSHRDSWFIPEDWKSYQDKEFPKPGFPQLECLCDILKENIRKSSNTNLESRKTLII